mmetsp:Transcript_3412/g.5765  ORF Transcript_3412/g.5765 Transcript_3412/m.5765 type:complete len:309 (+) Transcript_3412:1259-2185(+)
MVPDQVLARHPQVEGVPVLELPPHRVQLLLRHFAALLVVSPLEDVLPAAVAHVLSLDADGSHLRAVDDSSLEVVGDGVVGHVDGGVREGLDLELFVPGQSGAQTLRPRAPPLLEPVDDELELVLRLNVVGLEVLGGEVGAHKLLPVLLTVAHEPLVARGHDALVARSRDNLALRLVVGNGQLLVEEVLLDLGLCLFDRLANGYSHDHLALVEAFEVDLVLGLLQELLVLLGLDFEVVDQLDGGEVSELGDFDDGHGLEGDAPAGVHLELLSQVLFGLQVSEGGPVVRRVRGDTGDDSGSLRHRDGRHG